MIDFLKQRLKPLKIIIFGSRAKQRSKYYSDFDICIVGAIKPHHTALRKIKEELDKIFGIYSYDLVFWEDLSDDFKKVINETGRVIYEKSGSNTCS